MSDERIVEQFKLLKRAKKLEQMGNSERALDLYLELHEKYDPNTSDAYERPAVLLEKYKRYDEALKLCHEAIEEINNDRISGTIDKFEKRISSIEDKLKTVPVKQEIKTKYQFGVIGFRSKKPIKMITAGIVYILFIALGVFLKTPFITLALMATTYGFTYFIDIIQTKGKHRITLTILTIMLITLATFSIIQLPSAFDEEIKLEDKEDSLEGGENIFKPSEDLPVITDEHITNAITIIENEVEVIEAIVIVNEAQVTFGLLLQPQTNEDKAIKLSETFIEALAHQASKDNDIKAPTSRSLGELYDYYYVVISAGTDDVTIVAKGTKGTSSKYIKWLH